MTTLALSEASQGLDLTFPQWRVLVVLGDSEQGAPLSVVSSAIGVTLPATSRQLRRLERRGLVSLGPDERDRRVVRVRLTETGRSARDAIVAFRRRRVAEILAGHPIEPGVADRLAAIADALEAAR